MNKDGHIVKVVFNVELLWFVLTAMLYMYDMCLHIGL